MQRGRTTIYDQLIPYAAAFDALLRDASAGVLPPREYDRLESQAQTIADGLVATFRGTAR